MIEDVAAYQPWPVVRGALRGEGGAGDADPGFRARARAGGPRLRRRAGTGRGRAGQEERRAAETLLGRVGSPDDVADAVVYLAGASFVTGTTLVVDGGRSLQSGATPHAVESSAMELTLDTLRLPRASEPATIRRWWPTTERRRADHPNRRRRPGRVRRALPALRAAGVRARAAPARRPRPRRGRDAGDVRLDLARRPSYRPERGPGAPGSTPSRATRSSTAAAPEPSRRPRCRSWPPPRPARPSAPSRRGAPGASTAPSRSCPSTSASVIELAYWSGLSQSRDRRVPEHPARHGQDAHPRGARRASPCRSRRSWMTRPPDLRRARRRGRPEPEERRAPASACTTCWSRPGRRPSCRRSCCEPGREQRRRATSTSAAAPPHGAALALAARDRADGASSAGSSPARGTRAFDEAVAVPMHGTAAGSPARPRSTSARPTPTATGRCGSTSTGLPELPKGGYYEMFLSRGGDSSRPRAAPSRAGRADEVG